MKHTFSLLLAVTLFSLTFKSYGQEVNISTATVDYYTWFEEPGTDGHWVLKEPPICKSSS